MVLFLALAFLLASIVLVKSASIAVRSISTIARKADFSPFFTSFILAGLVSIMPELFIGMNSAFIGQSAVGIGTVIGSNVADMTLLVGIVALVGRRIGVDRRFLKNIPYFVALTALPLLLMADGNLTRDDGFVLVVAFLLYLWTIMKKENVFSRKRGRRRAPIQRELVVFVLAMIVLFISAHFMVETGVEIATVAQVPALLIGLLVIALGTTLPEFSFSVRAVLAHHKEIALGDLLGNVAIDSTLTIGIIALLNPLQGNFALLMTSLLFMILGSLVVVTLLQAGKKITWQESFLLFFIYGLFIALEFLIQGIFLIS